MKRQMNDEINAVENHEKEKEATTTTVIDPRRTEMKKMINRMNDKQFERYMEWHELHVAPTAEGLINAVIKRDRMRRRK